MTNQPLSLPILTVEEGGLRRRAVRRFASLIFLASVIVFLFAACSHEKVEEAAVPVKAATVQKTAIQRIVAADAVLFPLQQSALVPKISAPVKTFYVNRGSKVHKGQLLAVLEKHPQVLREVRRLVFDVLTPDEVKALRQVTGRINAGLLGEIDLGTLSRRVRKRSG